MGQPVLVCQILKGNFGKKGKASRFSFYFLIKNEEVIMRPMWSGALSFGLINIPIKVMNATQEHPLSFDMLHNKDLSPIRFARICKEDGKEIPYEEIVKGYEYQKGEYIVIEDEDFQKANPKRVKTIDIQEFVYEQEIDSIYFTKPYYLEPDKGAAKAYNLLCEALTKSKKVGIAKFIFRNKEHLGVIKPMKNILVLNQLRFASEVRAIKDLEIPETESNKKEVEMALKLIEQLTNPFNPEQYTDTYTEEMLHIIDQKVKGIKPSKKKEASEKPSKVHDIMSLLKASLKSDPKEKAEKKPKTVKKSRKVV